MQASFRFILFSLLVIDQIVLAVLGIEMDFERESKEWLDDG